MPKQKMFSAKTAQLADRVNTCNN